MRENKRLANVELLRILAMAMVVVLHFLSHSHSLLETGESLGVVRIMGTVLEMFCLCAVNVYVFISGYFGVKGRFHPGKALELLCRIWFYALLIPLVLVAAGVPTLGFHDGGIDFYGLMQYFFPIETEHYWFATSYFVLYLFTPVINSGVKNLSKRQMQVTIGGLLILFSGIKSVSPAAFAVDRYGYDPVWFICVYLVAAYFGLHGSAFFEKRGWQVYAASSAAGIVIQIAGWFLCRRWSGFSYYFTVPYHYNFIFSLTGAIGLFYGFYGLRIREGRGAGITRKLGALSFGVYLLHEHIDLRGLWYGQLSGIINPEGKQGVLYFLLELVFCTMVLMAAGFLADWLRSLLFHKAVKLSGKTGLARRLRKLDEYFLSESGK